ALDGSSLIATLPSAPPSYESWNWTSAGSAPPSAICRLPSEAPRSTSASGVERSLSAVLPVPAGQYAAPLVPAGHGLRSRIVTGSTKFTSDALRRKDRLLIERGFFLICLRSWRRIFAFCDFVSRFFAARNFAASRLEMVRA